MPGAISDSSTLIHLSMIGHLTLLRDFFSDVMVPPAVWQEVVEEGQGRTGSLEVEEAAHAGWLKVVTPSNRELVRLIKQSLDEGESEAITLALEHPGYTLLLDEADGRRIANIYNLSLTGTIGLLMRAKLEGKVPSFRDELDRLRHEAGFWISNELYNKAVQDIGESLD